MSDTEVNVPVGILFTHPAEQYRADVESPPPAPPEFAIPPFPVANGSLEGTRAAYQWAELVCSIHGTLSITFIQGRMIEAANALDEEKHNGWKAIGRALHEMTRNPTDDDVIH